MTLDQKDRKELIEHLLSLANHHEQESKIFFGSDSTPEAIRIKKSRQKRYADAAVKYRRWANSLQEVAEAGKMPERPQELQFAKLKGDAGMYQVWGFNWLSSEVLIYRAGEYVWFPISKVKLVAENQ